MPSHWPLTILNSLVSGLQIFIPLFLVRVFSVENIGHYKIFFLYLGIFPMLSFTTGFVQGVYFWAGDQVRGQKLIQQSWTLLFSLACFVGTLGVVFSPKLSNLLGWQPVQTLAFVAAASLSILAQFYEEACIATQRIWKGGIFRAVVEIFRCAAIVATALFTRNIFMVFCVHSIVLLLKVGCGAYFGNRLGFIGLTWNSDLRHHLYKYAIPVSAAGLMSVISNYSDQLFLSRLLTSADFATFAVGCLAIPPFYALEQSINQVLIPSLSQQLAEKNQIEGAKLYGNAMVELASFMIPAALGLAIFAEPVIKLLFTSKFSQAIPVLRVFSIYYLLMIIPYDAGPRAAGKGNWTLRVYVVKAITSVLLVILLTHYFGLMGALSAGIITSTGMRFSAFLFNRYYLGWSLKNYLFLRPLTKILVWSLSLGFACFLLRPFFSTPLRWCFTCGPVFYLAVVLQSNEIGQKYLEKIKSYILLKLRSKRLAVLDQ